MATKMRDEVQSRARTVGHEIGAFGWLMRTAVLGTVGWAIYTELRKPPAERTWHGKVAGFVPYDFRIPKLADVKRAYWNPASPKLFTDRPLGVGWAVNIPTALRRIGIMGSGRSRPKGA
jgi:hypothetical protein